jgi:hypothetical protein
MYTTEANPTSATVVGRFGIYLFSLYWDDLVSTIWSGGGGEAVGGPCWAAAARLTTQKQALMTYCHASDGNY